MIKAMTDQDINYLMDGHELRRFYPHLYYMGAQKTVYNWTNYFKFCLHAIFDSILVYYIPVLAFTESDILNGTGVNIDLWSVSLTSFTCLYIAVTVRICAYTRWWTWLMFFTVTFLSLFLYIAFIWVMEAGGDWTLVQFVADTHTSPLFFLILFFFTMLMIMVNLGLEYTRLTFFKDASDWVRIFVNEKMAAKAADDDGEITIS